jgi:hypothetical protein
LREATGLFLFVGCNLSLSKSITSFIEYTEEEINTKDKKARKTFISFCVSKEKAKKIGAKTKMFLCH